MILESHFDPERIDVSRLRISNSRLRVQQQRELIGKSPSPTSVVWWPAGGSTYSENEMYRLAAPSRAPSEYANERANPEIPKLSDQSAQPRPFVPEIRYPTSATRVQPSP